jgi:hypothetical protein
MSGTGKKKIDSPPRFINILNLVASRFVNLITPIVRGRSEDGGDELAR